MVAFALRADGWYLRSDVIWAKPNPMPESVTDRPTNAHEHVFLLTKSARYFYDAEAIREKGVNPANKLPGRGMTLTEHYGAGNGGNAGLLALRNRLVDEGSGAMGRNKRNVWEIATQAYAEAHFATFPTKLVEPCLLAGSSPKACGQCGAPWQRVMELGESSWQERKAHGATRGNVAFGGNVGAGTQRAVHGVGVSNDLTRAPGQDAWLGADVRSPGRLGPVARARPVRGLGHRGRRGPLARTQLRRDRAERRVLRDGPAPDPPRRPPWSTRREDGRGDARPNGDGP